MIEFNPEGALQKHIFADGFVPNSPEFVLPFEGLTYTGQRAENLVSGAVRIYYAQTGDWANVERIERSNLGGRALEILLLAQGGISQVIEFNPGAALQKRIFADGMVPNSSEFILQVAGVTYSAQRAEHLSTGAVHVYYAQPGDWSNVQFVSRS